MEMPESKRKLFRWRWWKIAILAGIVLILLLWIGVPVKVRTGKTVSTNNFSTHSSTSRSGVDRFACAHIVVFELSGHPLLERVAEQVVMGIKAAEGVDCVEYYPCGSSIGTGERTPDVFITLDLKRFKNTGLGIGQKLEADVEVSMGKRPASCQASEHSSLSPPVVDFNWGGTLHHKSRFTGFASLNLRYAPYADDIAEQIGGALTKQLSEWRKKYGTLPKLPGSFYPDYREVEGLTCLDSYEAKRMMGCHGLMTHNESFWRFQSDRAMADVLADVQEQAAAEGWSTVNMTTDRNMIPRLRMKKDRKVFLVYPESAPTFVRSVEISINGAPSGKTSEARTFWAEYEDPMTREGLDEAIEGLFALDASGDALLVFASAWTPSQRDRALELFSVRPPVSPAACLTLVKILHNRKNDEEARKWLLRARVARCSVGGEGDLTRQIRKAAEDLGDETLAHGAIPREAFLDMGWTELQPGAEVPERELQPNEPVRFIVRTADDKLKTICVRAIQKRLPDGTTAYELAHVDTEGSSTSWGSRGFGGQREAYHHSYIDDVGVVILTMTKVSGKEMFQLKCRFDPS